MVDIFKTIVQFNIQACFLVFAVIVLRLLLRKAPRSLICAFWALVAVRLIIPIRIESIFSLVPDTEIAARTVGSYAAERITGAVWEYPQTFLHTTDNTVIQEKTDIIWNTLPRIAAYIWTAGVVIMLIYTFVSYTRLYRMTREGVMIEKGVYLCDHIPSPFILGVFRPRIFLPTNMGEHDKPYVLEHEKTHIKRLDHLWKPLGFLLLSVYWFNPLLWVAYVLLCRDIESACDERVIRELGADAKKPYAIALVNSAAPRRQVSACPLAFGETNVKSRVKSVLNYKKPAFWIIIVAVVLSIAVAVCFLTNPVNREKLLPDDVYAFASADVDGDGKTELFTLSPKPASSVYSIEINAYDPETYEKKYKPVSAVNCWNVGFECDDLHPLIVTGYNLMMNTPSDTDIYYRCAVTVTDGQLGLSEIESISEDFPKDADPSETVKAFFKTNADKFPMNTTNQKGWTWANVKEEYYGGTYLDGATQVIMLTDVSQSADYTDVGRDIRYEKCEHSYQELEAAVSSINSALNPKNTGGFSGSVVELSIIDNQNKIEVCIFNMTDEKVQWFKETICDDDYLVFRNVTTMPGEDISDVVISDIPEIIFANDSIVYIAGDCGVIFYDIENGEIRGMLSPGYIKDLGYRKLYATASDNGNKIFLYDVTDPGYGSEKCGVFDLTSGTIMTSSRDYAENEEIFMFDTVQDGFKAYKTIPKKNGITYTLTVPDNLLRNMELTLKPENGKEKTYKIFE